MEIKDIKAVYFVGAGGIGMSAIARYFIKKGLVVAGYDKTPSTLTQQLEKEGMLIHYTEDVDAIPNACKQPASCLVIYTPAIPENHQEMQYLFPKTTAPTIYSLSPTLSSSKPMSSTVLSTGCHPI